MSHSRRGRSMKRPSRQHMTAKLSESIHQQLNMGYAIGAGATTVGILALSELAESKIVYTPTHRKLTNGGKLLIDLNHDGITDFVIAIKPVHWNSMCTFCGQCLRVNGNGNAGAGVMGTKVEAAALRRGWLIGSHDSFQNVQDVGRLMAYGFDSNASFRVTGQFAGKKDRFLGVRVEIRGKVHYGWLRFADVTVVLENGVALVVTAILNGYACQTIPDKPIIAGET
jgi:hypothetical protein